MWLDKCLWQVKFTSVRKCMEYAVIIGKVLEVSAGELGKLNDSQEMLQSISVWSIWLLMSASLLCQGFRVRIGSFLLRCRSILEQVG